MQIIAVCTVVSFALILNVIIFQALIDTITVEIKELVVLGLAVSTLNSIAAILIHIAITWS